MTFLKLISIKVFNSTYRDNMIKLKNLVLVKFNQDMMVVPRESEVRQFFPFLFLIKLLTNIIFLINSGLDFTKKDKLMHYMKWRIHLYTKM